MHTKIIEGIENVDREQWRRVTTPHPFAGWDWCRYGEQIIGAPGYYVLVYDGDTPVGGACFYVMHNDFLPIRNPLLHRVVKWYLRRFPMVVARTAYGTDHTGIFLPPDAGRHERVFEQILQAGRQLIRQKRGSFLICDYLEEKHLDRPWSNFIKLRDFLDVGTLLNIGEYNSFDDYLSDLRQQNGKRPVQDIRRHSKRALEQGITVTFSRELPQRERAIELIQTIDEKYKEVFNRPFTNAIIDSVATLPPEAAFWMTAQYEGKLVACELILYDPDNGVCSPYLFGRDQSVEYSYFYTFYEDIRYAIETLNARTLIGNAGKEHFKLRLGFEPDYRNHFAVYTPSMVSRLVANVLIVLLNRQESEATAGPSAPESQNEIELASGRAS